MTQTILKPFTLSAALVLLASPLAAQTMSTAQCDTIMMVGTQNYAPAQVAGCTAYLQSLADGAVARGTFATPVPRGVTLSTSGTGG